MGKINRICRFLTFGLLNIILLGAPVILFCQPRAMGILNFTRESDWSERAVKINNKPSIDGEVVISPSDIEVPVKTHLLIDLDKAGLVSLVSDSKMHLAFDETKITGYLFRGRLSVKVPAGIALNIQTTDGVVSTPDTSRENIVIIDFTNGKTRVKSLCGSALLNGTPIAAGQFFIAGKSSAELVIPEQPSAIYSYFILPVATILDNVFESAGATSITSFGSEQTNVGPMK